jgi:hypothetical protein
MKTLKLKPLNIETVKTFEKDEIPILPDFDYYLRILSIESPISVGIKKMKQLSLVKWLLMIVEGIKNIPSFVLGPIPTIFYLVLYFEYLTLKTKPKIIVVHDKFFDMFMLNEMTGIFKKIGKSFGKKKIAVLFSTNNPYILNRRYNKNFRKSAQADNLFEYYDRK